MVIGAPLPRLCDKGNRESFISEYRIFSREKQPKTCFLQIFCAEKSGQLLQSVISGLFAWARDFARAWEEGG
jgi:hypothetical protein